MNNPEKPLEWYRSKYAYILILLALLGSFANVIYSIGSYKWPAGDESWHYSYSQRYFETGETERETVHNYNSTTPVVVLNVLAVKIYERYTGNLIFNKKVARSIQVSWYILLVLGIGVVSYYIASANVAWWSIFLLLLDPNLSAHSALIGSDIPFVSVSMWLLLSIFIYLNKPNIYRAIVVGLLYGLAFCTKYSATFYAIPIFLALLSVASEAILNKTQGGRSFVRTIMKKSLRFLAVIIHGLTIVLMVTGVVNLAYSFAGTGQPLIVKPWYTDIFKYLRDHLGTIPSPWPIPFLSGFDHQLSVERIMPWNVVLLGQHFPNGVWYYFIVVWAVKISLGVIVLTLVALILSPIVLRKWRNFKMPWAIIGVTWLSLFVYFSFIFRTQVGLRYAFPCLPLVYILIAGFISRTTNFKLQSQIATLIFLMAAFETIPYFGNEISFTNSMIANKTEAYKYVADSNIDWFHNYPSAEAEARESIGEYHLNPPHILAGNNVFALNKLTGVMHNFPQYAWIRKNWKPNKHFQHTLLWYNVDKTKFEEYLDAERTYREPLNASAICDPLYTYKNLNEYPALELEGRESPLLYSGCLAVTEETVIEVKIKNGSAIIGTYLKEYNCEGLTAEWGNSLWFKFEPGMHPICAKVKIKADIDIVQHRGKAKFALRIR